MGANLTGFDIRAIIVFPPDGLPKEPPKHGNLSDVR